MAARGWGASIATAVGVAAGAGAAQLGLGYGLGVIAWLPATAADGEAAWVAALTWASWIAATSVVAGAICADRMAGSPGPESMVDDDPAPAGPGPLAALLWRLAMAAAAAIGGLVTVILVAVPARAAERADTFAPQLVAGGYAVIGVVVGLVTAFGALASRAVATNIIVTVSWLWLLATAAVTHGAVTGQELAGTQPGVWEFTTNGPWLHNLYLPGMLLSLVAALVIGVFTAWPAARRGDGRVGVAVCGAAGPLLIATTYFLAVPRLAGVHAEQFSAYLLAPYAVLVGLAGSVLACAVGPATGTRVAGLPADRRAPVPTGRTRPEPEGVIHGRSEPAGW